MSAFTEIKSYLRAGDGFKRLLIINFSLFILIQIAHVIWRITDQSELSRFHPDVYLAASSSFSEMLKRPWSLITHMFAHEDVGHFLFNMIALYTTGKLFRHFLGPSKLVVNYVLGGLSGYFLFFLFYNLFPAFDETSFILGASAAVMSIIITVGVLRPDYSIRLFGVFEMKLIWLCGILVLVDLISLRKGFNSGGHIGHLGGALFGFIYATQYKKGKNMASWLERLFYKWKGLFSSKSKKSYNTGRPKTDEQFNSEKLARQKRVDQILDKIGRAGYDSLSKEEKEFLFKYSQK